MNGPEECDVGSLNVAAYGDQDGCTPGCFSSRFCGDGVVDGDHGEACDLGDLNGAPGQRCALGCTVIGTRWTECVRVCL